MISINESQEFFVTFKNGVIESKTYFIVTAYSMSGQFSKDL